MPLRATLAALLIVLAGAALASERHRRPPPNPCAAHGPGFAAIPGTTTCVRASGHIRGEADMRSSRAGGADRARLNAEARATLDARTATSEGPLRSVVQVRGRRGEPGR
jgi:Porin subfamily